MVTGSERDATFQALGTADALFYLGGEIFSAAMLSLIAAHDQGASASSVESHLTLLDHSRARLGIITVPQAAQRYVRAVNSHLEDCSTVLRAFAAMDHAAFTSGEASRKESAALVLAAAVALLEQLG